MAGYNFLNWYSTWIPACVASIALRTAAWKPTFKSVFVGLRTVSSVVCNTCNTTEEAQQTQRHARLVTQSKSEIHNARMQKNTTRAINSMLCVHCVFRVRELRFFYLYRMSSVCCVRCVAYSSLETDLQSVFIGLRAVSKLSYTTHATQRTLCNGRNAWLCEANKNRYTQCMHAKKQCTQSILFFELRFSCAYIACIASIALRTTAWKPTFKSVFCILMAAAVFRRSARVHQPAIAKFLIMHDG